MLKSIQKKWRDIFSPLVKKSSKHRGIMGWQVFQSPHARRIRAYLPLCRNITLIILTILIIFSVTYLTESREGFIATPFVQPWMPALLFAYRVHEPEQPETNALLAEFKNPCYLQRHANEVFGEALAKSEANRHPDLFWRARVQVEQGDGTVTIDTLRCVPYYYVLGWPKCGTSDLHAKMMAHPYILRTNLKEPAWFNNHRFNESDEFSSLNVYIDYYNYRDSLAMANYFSRYGGKVPFIVGDHSTHTIDMNCVYEHGFTYNNRTPPNAANVKSPTHTILQQYSTPLLIHQLFPGAKFVVMLRDPVERLFSLYRMHDANSPEDFHRGCEAGIRFWRQCIQDQNSDYMACIYADLVKDMSTDDRKSMSKWTSRAVNSVRKGIYVVFLAEWFSIFTREQFLTLKFEDWVKHNSEAINDQVFPFLGLPKLSGFNEYLLHHNEHASVIRNRPKGDGSIVQPWTQGDMLPETRKMLRDFYHPYNEQLQTLLNDPSFNWNYAT